ncbi:MAG: LysE family transporter [Paludibacter sp.]|nr:LysE family transporter [Paludibacter sp.]MDD4199364.1 LysE family transporter [Paludibacter sp.]MDD4428806.1 LysE family transporter [Paludibacter sp.]
MIETIIKGIIIGLFISVPLGPIGMLCVQRTLNRGRKYGIATGLGATTSDLIYTIIALFFIGFVVDFIEDKKAFIQIIGSLIVIIFGLFIFKNNPARQPIPNQNKSESLIGDFISSFILTFSNPLILLILIALFARLEFLDENTTIFHNVVGILSILGGALLWWSLLTLLVSKFRNKLSYSGIKLINRIIGIIIICIGSFGALYSLFSLF